MDVSPAKTPTQSTTPEPTASDVSIPDGQSESGISGQVLMGPVCPGPVRVDEPCPDEPFSATFYVFDDQENQVASFQSDEGGLFQIYLIPGRYTIVPDESAPIMRATQQKYEVVVRDKEITQVTLIYDTGQRWIQSFKAITYFYCLTIACLSYQTTHTCLI